MSESALSGMTDAALAETIRTITRQLEAAIAEASERRMEVRIDNVGSHSIGARFQVRITKEI